MICGVHPAPVRHGRLRLVRGAAAIACILGAVAVARPAAAATASDPVVAIAGDIACDPADPNFSGARAATCQMRATAQRIVKAKPAYVLPLGDTQYSNSATQGQQPTPAMYRDGYGTSWGTLSSQVPGLRVRPVAGNHEYGDVSESSSAGLSASNYLSYFSADLPPEVGATHPWYSYDIPVSGGSWHMVALDSECAAVGGCGVGSPQEQWLQADLAAHRNQCIGAYWHEPLFSGGGEGGNPAMAALWTDLVNARAAVVFAGHSHSYEHFGPQDASGRAVTGGVSEFVVGTGGADLQGFASTRPNTVYRQSKSFGTLNVTLHAGSMDHRFVTTSGATMDAGSISCPPPPAADAPVVAGVSPVSGPSAGGTSVVISGSNLGGATGVSFGSVAAKSFTVGSSTQITAVAPPGGTGVSTVDVRVTTPAGVSAVGVADEFTYQFSTNGYAVTLAASSSTPVVGQSVTLTATANKDMGPTPYGISIMDATTGAELVHTGSGTTLTLVVSQSAATTRRYVALISNAAGANAQADSAPRIVTWR
jgi:hypothetical protein